MAAQFPASKAVFRPPSDTNPDNSMASRRIYLDHNASAPLLDSARESVVEALGVTGNASSVHAEGRAVRAVIDKARQQVAAFAGVNGAKIVFTSGATEAANMVLTPDFVFGRTPQRFSALYVGATEHPCVLAGGRFAPDAMTILPVGGGEMGTEVGKDGEVHIGGQAILEKAHRVRGGGLGLIEKAPAQGGRQQGGGAMGKGKGPGFFAGKG